MSMRQRAVRAVTWSAVSAGGGQLSGVVIFVVLARMLPPEAFGLVAWAGVFVGFLQVFVNAGLTQALVQRERLEDGHLDAALWASLALSVLLGAAVVAAATPLAAFLEEPMLAPVLRWLAWVLPLNALSAVPQAILRRELRFKPLAMRVLLANTVGGVCGIAMALAGLGIWALVGQQLSGGVAATIVLWTSISWRPGLAGGTRHLRELARFGGGMAGGALMRFVSHRVDHFLLGAILGPEALGIYVVGMRAVRAVTELASRTLNSVSLPVLSKFQSDHARLRNAIRTTGQANGFISFPAFAALGALAPDLVPAAFGEQWLPSIPVLQVLAVYAAINSVRVVSGPVLNSLGRSDWTFYLAAVEMPFSVALLAWAARHGPVFTAGAVALQAALMVPLFLFAIRRLIAMPVRQILAPYAVPLLAGCALAGVIEGLRAPLGETNVWARMGVQTACAAVTYLVCVRVLSPDHLTLMQDLLGRALPSWLRPKRSAS